MKEKQVEAAIQAFLSGKYPFLRGRQHFSFATSTAHTNAARRN